MPMLRKVVFATLILAMASATAMACDCATGSVEENFESADVVFAGTVLYVDRSTGQTTFQVGSWIKGRGGDAVSVSSHLTDCDYPFYEGLTYIVYARKFNGKLIAGACGGSNVIGHSPQFGPLPVKCSRFETSNRSYSGTSLSYTEIATVTGICVSLSLGLGMLVMRIKRRFKK